MYKRQDMGHSLVSLPRQGMGATLPSMARKMCIRDRVQTVVVAGRAGGGADAVPIQIQQDGLAFQTREADVHIVGQTLSLIHI